MTASEENNPVMDHISQEDIDQLLQVVSETDESPLEEIDESSLDEIVEQARPAAPSEKAPEALEAVSPQQTLVGEAVPMPDISDPASDRELEKENNGEHVTQEAIDQLLGTISEEDPEPVEQPKAAPVILEPEENDDPPEQSEHAETAARLRFSPSRFWMPAAALLVLAIAGVFGLRMAAPRSMPATASIVQKFPILQPVQSAVLTPISTHSGVATPLRGFIVPVPSAWEDITYVAADLVLSLPDHAASETIKKYVPFIRSIVHDTIKSILETHDKSKIEPSEVAAEIAKALDRAFADQFVIKIEISSFAMI